MIVGSGEQDISPTRYLFFRFFYLMPGFND